MMSIMATASTICSDCGIDHENLKEEMACKYLNGKIEIKDLFFVCVNGRDMDSQEERECKTIEPKMILGIFPRSAKLDDIKNGNAKRLTSDDLVPCILLTDVNGKPLQYIINGNKIGRKLVEYNMNISGGLHGIMRVPINSGLVNGNEWFTLFRSSPRWFDIFLFNHNNIYDSLFYFSRYYCISFKTSENGNGKFNEKEKKEAIDDEIIAPLWMPNGNPFANNGKIRLLATVHGNKKFYRAAERALGTFGAAVAIDNVIDMTKYHAKLKKLDYFRVIADPNDQKHRDDIECSIDIMTILM